MKEANIKSTRIPYFLYFMRNDKAKIVQEDNGELNLYYEGEKVDYEKMNKPFIFLLKHLVPIYLLYAMVSMSIFQAVNNWLVPLAVFAVIAPVFYLYMYKSHLMLFYFIGIGILMYYVAVYGDNIIIDVNFSFTLVTWFLYFVFLAFDIYLTYKHFGYYYIKSVTTKVQVKNMRPHLTIGFWKLKKTFYFSKQPKSISIGFIGTFVKVPNEVTWSEK